MYIDLTGVATAFIAGVFSILGVALPLMLQKFLKDKQAADVLSNAVTNALGAIQQAALKQRRPPDIEDGIDYVVNHAGPEAARFDVSREAIADKIEAKRGLQSLAAQAPAPPLARVPVVSVGDSPTVYRYGPYS